jgi:hypothetical protein
VSGTGRLTSYTALDSNHAGFSVTVDTPERICVKLEVSTGACEAKSHAEGVVSAIEALSYCANKLIAFVPNRTRRPSAGNAYDFSFQNED